MDKVLSEERIDDVFVWIDSIPLSRRKRNINRDFSDGVMVAEVVKHFFPNMVDLKNYVPANSIQRKISNWEVLNRKVFPWLNFHVPQSTVKKLALNTAGEILPVLHCLRQKINKLLNKMTHHTTDLKDRDTQQNAPADAHLTRVLPQAVAKKSDEGKRHEMSQPQWATNTISNKKPECAQKLTKQQPNVADLQETVEILQKKVSRLEDLVHLKDGIIESLRQQLKVYQTMDAPH